MDRVDMSGEDKEGCEGNVDARWMWVEVVGLS
jgi:hypothetical protein